MTTVLDHLVLITADLQRTSDWIAERTGVVPTYGGRHPGAGTHNALLALGEDCYLEILAPVSRHALAQHPWAQLARAAEEPRLLTYCVRPNFPLLMVAGRLEAQGWRESPVTAGERTCPDGSTLRWRILRFASNPFGFAFPFFIDWGNQVHPARSLQAAGHDGRVRLGGFAVGNPRATSLAKLLGELGHDVVAYRSDRTEFRVWLDTPRGSVRLPSD